MKNLSFIFLLFCSAQVFAQTKGITYQAVIYNPSGESLPGVNNANAPMASKNVCLQFSIVDGSAQVEYQESISTTTDEFGMVNLVIGNGIQTSGYATSFSNISWSADQKSLKVALDIAGQCTDFVDISSQKFEAVPYAFSATTADYITGILPIENGGTNASTVLGAKTNLGLENVDNTSDLNKPISTATQAALDLKEDQVNKSTSTTLGTSDILYPTQNAVKTYVDAGTTNINAAIANEAAIRAAADAVLTTDLATEVTNRINGDNTLTTNLATEVTNRINGDNTLTTNLGVEVLNRTNADNVLTTNLATEVTNRTNADLLKEDLANKSTATTLGTSNILYPTQNAVKTYVDATSTSNTTALNNEAAIRAAADVVLTNDLATEVTNRTNADLLKENTSNKSTATSLGTSNVLFPTQNAVKSYVDASATTNAAAVTNEAAIRAAADVVLTNNLATEVTNRTNADLLKENLANKSTNTTLGTSDVLYPTQNAVKTYVDANAVNGTNALNNEAAIRAAADVVLTNNLATEVTNRINGDNNLATSIAAEVTNRTNADLLKEDLTNKSTDVILDGSSNIKYPTVKSMKDYVDAGTATSTGAITNEAAIRAAADVVLTNNLATEVTNRTNADLLKEDLVNKSNNIVVDGTSTVKYPTTKTVKDYVDLNATTAATNLSNETAARIAADNTLTTNLNTEALNRINADLLKENAANKSTATTLGNSDVLFPTQNAVKTYVDANATSNSTAISNEAAIRAAADAVLTSNLATEVAARTNGDNTLTTDLTNEVTNRTNSDLLKENTANKSTATSLGTSDVLFPTQNAVKTYVDATATATSTAVTNEAAIRAAADATLTTNLATEVTNRTNADLLKENTSNKSTATALGTSDVLFPTQNAVKSYVDASAATNATAVTNEAAIRAAADATLTSNLATEVTNRTNADLLKENTANKSTATTLGTSDVLFPTQNAVKSYVDANSAAATTGLNNEAAIRAAADVVLTNDLATEVTNRTNADLLKENTANKSTATTLGTSDVLFPTQNAVKTYVDASATSSSAALANEAAIRAAADVTLTNNLATEITNRTNADLLKENTANKSTATALGTSDVLFPTQNAVKSYVDASAIVATNAVTNEAVIRAAADAVLTTNLATEIANRTNAVNTLTTNLATEVTNRTNADLLKENTANKSASTSLGNSNVLYPTQNAVKSYVDASATSNANAVTNEAAIRAAADVVLTNNIATEVTNRTNADLLKENSANKSSNTALGTSDVLFPTQNAVKSYVDANASSNSAALSNEAAIRAAADIALSNDIATETANRVNADAILTTNLNNEAVIRAGADVTLTNSVTNETNARIAGDNLLNTDLTTEIANRTSADQLKEDLSNKSSSPSLGTSNVLYPTQYAVKTYVDINAANANSAISNEAAIRANADVVLTNNLSTETTARIAGDATLTTNLATEITDRTNGDAALTTNLATEVTNRTNADNVLSASIVTEGQNRTSADMLKEDLVNKSTATTLGTSNVLYPTQNAVKSYVDAATAAGTSGLSNEAAIRAAADVVLTNNLSAETAARTAADATLTTNLAAEVTARTAAEATLTTNLATEVTNRTNADATLTSDLAAEVTNRTNADLLKENLANKSTTVTLGTSDVLYPTQNAVKTYVDASTAAGSAGVSNEAAIRAAADVVLTNNLSAETAARTAADATLTSNLAAEVTNRTNADLLKENLANKSTTVTLGTSDVLYPTQNAVKTYVDASTAAGSAGVSNEAAIRAAADVVLTNDLATEVAARTAADLLKENTANKSINVILDGASDVKFPSVKAVKTYVDTYSTINAISTVSANYTALITDYTILSNSTAGAFTLTLPNAASYAGKVYVIRKVDETNNVLNFSPALKLTETTTISSINYPKTIRIQSNGTSWYIID
jgi:hypothetical protein